MALLLRYYIRSSAQAAISGSAAWATPGLTGDGSGVVGRVGEASAAMPPLAATGEGAVGGAGAGSAVLPRMAGDGTGQAGRVGTASHALSTVDGSAVGAAGRAGTMSAAMPATQFGALVNEPPVVIDPIADQAITEGDSVQVDLLDHFLDPESGSLTFDVASGSQPWIEIVLVALPGGTKPFLLISPEAGDAAGSPYSVTIEATDPGGLTVSDTFTIAVASASGIVGIVAAMLPTIDASGDGAAGRSGVGTGQLPLMEFGATALATIVGTAGATLPSVAATGVGAVGRVGAAASTAPKLGHLGQGTTGRSGAATAVLASVGFRASELPPALQIEPVVFTVPRADAAWSVPSAPAVFQLRESAA